ncbi:permease [Natranaerobius thermophilus]|uniref:Permease n=1 Tax=Natranaerobius thermophilus (strain ATCC BAA-1301 / DSM 18059 / JW/NM-WN-LF) TaxID=457570 RepID=B2A7P1_NATTJ|nr:permease [Natranaerobius thermophilus]ACB84343.1 permease [Natranaerobius thermophilus JW/NM-WN-LF]
MNGNIKKLIILVAVFLGAYFIPFESQHVRDAIMEAFYMLQYYAQEHVLTCLIPAFFIAGAIANFVSQGAVLKYFGAEAKKWLSYSVASVSGILLAVCSCTILPLFAGIYKRGAGIGPAIAFLYSGPAINLLAIVLTARVLGPELGIARAVGAIIFAIIIGLIMAKIFKADEQERANQSFDIGEEKENRTPVQNLLYFGIMVVILLLMTMGEPASQEGFWALTYTARWYLVVGLLIILGIILTTWFNKQERVSWVESTWGFAQQIFPLLFAGVFVAGLLMGRPDSDAGLIPAQYIEALVGGNSIQANFVASIIGSFMYFATLTEVPILQGLIGSGMGSGPALSLLLAGPALSLPNMLVIRSVLGTKKTAVFVVLVVVMATLSGLIYGNLF